MTNYYKNKEERAAKAQEHTAAMEALYPSAIIKSANGTKIYTGSVDLVQKPGPVDILLSYEDTVSAIYHHYEPGTKIAALNFASYKNPGGQFLDGSSTQEESLCHESFLYNVLSRFVGYYEWNNFAKNRALYLNRALYTPDIAFVRDNKLIYCDIITCAAPNKKAAQKYCNVSDEENRSVLKNRIHFVLDIAADNNVDILILGAYGCGVFGQDPSEVAQIFMEELGSYSFRQVIFAIPDPSSKNYLAFSKRFYEGGRKK